MERVVVTGIGLVTPVGNDVAATWDALRAGSSGGAPISLFDASGFPVRIAAEVKGFDPAAVIDDLGADSLGLVELVLAFEEAFEIDIPDEDTEKIRTVQDAIDYIESHKK